MSYHHKLELQLAARIEQDALCASQGISAALAERFGVLITCDGRPMGLWSVRNGELTFRHLASWDVRRRAPSAEEAVIVTLELSATNGWAK